MAAATAHATQTFQALGLHQTITRKAQSSAYSLRADRTATQALTKPRVLPPAPFFLTSTSVAVTCKVRELEHHLKTALKQVQVDYEFCAAKWKAKCYVYRPNACCHFAVRCYTERTNGNSQPACNDLPAGCFRLTPLPAQDEHASGRVQPADPEQIDNFVLELQRRKGCHTLFRTTFDGVLSHLTQGGILRPESAARLAEQVCIDRAVSTASTSSGTSLPMPPADLVRQSTLGLPPPAFFQAPEQNALPLSLLDPRIDPDDDSRSSSAEVQQQHEEAVADAFATLSSMLAKPWDDVACPAAMSISALAVGRRIRQALGAKVRPAFVAFQQAQQAGRALASVPAILTMFDALIKRVLDAKFTSVECRTACAMAIANLARDPSCGEVLFAMRAQDALLHAVLQTEPAACTAALRREAMAAFSTLLLLDDRADATEGRWPPLASVPSTPQARVAAAAATAEPFLAAFQTDSSRFRGFDTAFDDMVDRARSATARK